MSTRKYTVRVNLANYRQYVRHVQASSPDEALRKVAREIGLKVKVYETPRYEEDEAESVAA